jgi:hypothetical protein
VASLDPTVLVKIHGEIIAVCSPELERELKDTEAVNMEKVVHGFPIFECFLQIFLRVSF